MSGESPEVDTELVSTPSANGGATDDSMSARGDNRSNGTSPAPAQEHPPSCLNHALGYAGRGWRVFPLQPGGKRPRPGLLWRDQATADRATIKRWWQEEPDANIAITTGSASGIYVIDVDAKHHGCETLAALEAEHRPLPATFRVRTGGGGEHVYFRFQEGLANTNGKLGEGIDTRGEGGYVAGAPSLHSSGTRYEVLSDAPLADLPAWILQKLTEKPASKVISATGLEQYGRILDGRRNETLTSLGGYLRRRGLGEEAIVRALAGINETACFRELRDGDGTVRYEPHPLGEDEVRRIAASLAAYEPSAVPWQLDVNGGADTGRLEFVTGGELFTHVEEELEWIVRPWLAAGNLTEISGKQKYSGKTNFALSMVKAILDGEVFLDEETRQGPVVYLTEQPSTSFRRSMRRVGFGPEGHPDIHILFRRATANAAWEEIVAASVEKCLEVGAKALIVDTLSSVAKVLDENSAGEALAIMRPLVVAADEHGLGIFLIRHQRKEGGDTVTASRGSTAWSAEVDQVLTLGRLGGNNADPAIREISAIGRLLDIESTIKVRWSREDGYELVGDLSLRRKQRIRETIFRLLQQAEDGVMRRANLKEHEWLKEKRVTDEEYEEVEALEISLGRIQRHEGGRGSGRGGAHRIELLATTPPDESELDEPEDEELELPF